MTGQLTAYDYERLIRGFADHDKFCEHLAIRNKEGVTVPYRTSPAGKKLNRSIRKQELAGAPIRQVVLKASQVWMTSAASAEIFRRIPFFPGRRALVLADSEMHADLIFDYFRQYMESYSDHPYGDEFDADIKLPELVKDTERWIRWANDSSALVGTAYNVDIGRSAPYNWALMSEAGFYRDLGTLMTGLMQRIPRSPDSGVIVESTANGMGGDFYDLCQLAMDPRRATGWAFVFFGWHEHPENRLKAEPGFKLMRDELAELAKYNLHIDQVAWRRWMIETACEGKVDRFRQEHPACVTGETRISTEKGLLRIDEVGDCQMTESGSIVAAGPQPMSKIYVLNTACGRTLRGTYDHPIATPDGEFRCLSRLQPGDKIQLRQPRFADCCYELKWRFIPGAESSVVINREWGLLLGVFMGDGSWHADTFEISCDAQDEDVIALIESVTSSLLGTPHARTVARVQGRKGCTSLRLGCKAGREVMLRLNAIRLNSNDGSGSYIRNICVPEAIFRSPRPVVRAFLQGLFESDGSASAQKVRFASSKIQFVRDVQLLLLGFGINSRISANHKEANEHHNASQCWILSLGVEASRVFHDEIGFLGARKQQKRQYLSPSPLTARGKRIGTPPLPNDLTDVVVSVEEEDEDEDGLEDAVESVAEEPDCEVTYNLTVEPDHVFSANGILTHNTAQEAFQSSGRTIFDMTAVNRMRAIQAAPRGRLEVIEDGVEKRVQFLQSEDGRGELVIYKMPRKGGRYCIGADHAEGIDPKAKVGAGNSDPDYSSATVLDVDTGEEMAKCKERYEPMPWAERLYWLGRFYNWAFISGEAKAVGKAVLGHLLSLQYPLELLYSRQRDPSDRRSPLLQELWFDTNTVFRPILISGLDRAIREGSIAIHDPETIQELREFVRKPNGRESGVNHDDDVFSAALAVEGLPYAVKAFAYRDSRARDAATQWKPQKYGVAERPPDDD